MHFARSRWSALTASRAAISLFTCLLLSSAEPARGTRNGPFTGDRHSRGSEGFVWSTIHLTAPEGAAEPHLIHDAAFRARVEAQFAKQRRLARNRARELFDVLRRKITLEEREALKFLFAFMPLSDLADYDGEYYLGVVRTTLEARRTMVWGERIPEDVFLRYVLPHRVNTENLDEARSVIFGQLKDRVKDLPMADAVLEVNHWCHERVTYRTSDMRTSAPLATLRTSWGRCGEESTLVVTALRAVGIPAREVYTPRWAHVDDNHAWVEAWVDGQWRYLGACEPEAALDMAWFREPARRAMLVHTKVMGGTQGSEDRVRSTPWFDEINVLSTYAPTLVRVVKVVDSAGHPVADATVEFGLYNYAEFYPLATRVTDAEGKAALASGKGDLRIWGRKGPLVGHGKLSAQDGEGVIVLSPFKTSERVELLDLVPPVEPSAEPVSISSETLEKNQRRLAEEDRLREAYMATFMSQARSDDLAKELGLDSESLWSLTRKSQGNWPEIAGFLRQVPAKRRPWALALLGTLNEKDLRDTPAGILRDHLDHGLADAGWGAHDETRGSRDVRPQRPAREAASELLVSNVLAPRIAHELLRPWRGYLQNRFGPAFLKRVREDPERAVSWVRRKIRLDEEANCNRVPLSPRGVYDLRVADKLSRDIFFVALCRAAEVPARLEPATLRPQFHSGGIWKTVTWNGKSPAAAPVGRLSLSTQTSRGSCGPKSALDYYVHFTLARFQDGRYETLDFEGKLLELLPATLRGGRG